MTNEMQEEIIKRMLNEYDCNLNFAKGWDRSDILESWHKAIALSVDEIVDRIKKLDILLKPYEIEEIRLWKGRQLNKMRKHRFFDDVETIKKFDVMKEKIIKEIQDETK